MSPFNQPWDVIVVGGGFFGCHVALQMKQFFSRVLILEEASELFSRASRNNQARVHAGFHYPRSLLTAFRSQFNFKRFCNHFEEAIVDDFQKLYAVAQNQSKVNAYQFYKRFQEMGCEIERATHEIRRLFQPDYIEEVFSVKEVAFDYKKLHQLTLERLTENGVTILTQKKVCHIRQKENLSVEIETAGGEKFLASHVFNCTYSRINNVLYGSGGENYNLKHELTEICLIELPKRLEQISVTVVDGPFFSVMPFPAEKCHSLTHVRYTPHHSWQGSEHPEWDPYEVLAKAPLESNYILMLKDAKRYLPSLKEAKYLRSLYEVKTVLKQNESDDGRPILLKWNSGLINVHSILGAKLDNIYDVQKLIADRYS